MKTHVVQHYMEKKWQWGWQITKGKFQRKIWWKLRLCEGNWNKIKSRKIVSRKEEITFMRGFVHYWGQVEKEECFQKMRRLYLLLLLEYDNYLLAGFSQFYSENVQTHYLRSPGSQDMHLLTCFLTILTSQFQHSIFPTNKNKTEKKKHLNSHEWSFLSPSGTSNVFNHTAKDVKVGCTKYSRESRLLINTIICTLVMKCKEEQHT